ncbi:hypothetical protein DEI98_15980 [Curtobacterium sp. MCLR17_034]|nr:hypothetical protein DEI98_15980 [Curtobacterium sp. MCLR17_034]
MPRPSASHNAIDGQRTLEATEGAPPCTSRAELRSSASPPPSRSSRPHSRPRPTRPLPPARPAPPAPPAPAVPPAPPTRACSPCSAGSTRPSGICTGGCTWTRTD